MSRFILSLQADADLVGIYEYTLVEWGMDQFDIYRRQIENALNAIAADPMLVRSKARDDILKGCRFYRVEHHYIVYRMGSEEGVVEVGSILHGRMHFEQQVTEENF